MARVLETLTIPRVSASLPRLSGLRGLKMLPTKLRTTRSPSPGIVCEAQDTAVGVAVVTDPDWQSLVLESDLPVLVEFWAPWCGPCRMIHPVIDKLAKDHAGKLKCFKVNTDDCSTIATQYGIRSIPTIIIFKNGEKKEAVIGAVPESTLTYTCRTVCEHVSSQNPSSLFIWKHSQNHCKKPYETMYS